MTGGCTVHISDEIFELLGRKSVFSGGPAFAYVPRDAHAQIASGAGGRFALAGAKCERSSPLATAPRRRYPVAPRGPGRSRRPGPPSLCLHAYRNGRHSVGPPSGAGVVGCRHGRKGRFARRRSPHGKSTNDASPADAAHPLSEGDTA
ncbi:5-deoxy-glucuronate isomerase [Streptomyces sp. NPDC005773]|uniref:5-deoxy-glucuronate isomerase n=1 Tax=unclassified Streptomyces TaxID=2593676 RepID=UPI00368EB152